MQPSLLVSNFNPLKELTKMLPENPYVTPFIATSGILGTLTLENLNTTVAILVGVLTMCYLAIKIYKEIFTK